MNNLVSEIKEYYATASNTEKKKIVMALAEYKANPNDTTREKLKTIVTTNKVSKSQYSFNNIHRAIITVAFVMFAAILTYMDINAYNFTYVPMTDSVSEYSETYTNYKQAIFNEVHSVGGGIVPRGKYAECGNDDKCNQLMFNYLMENLDEVNLYSVIDPLEFYGNFSVPHPSTNFDVDTSRLTDVKKYMLASKRMLDMPKWNDIYHEVGIYRIITGKYPFGTNALYKAAFYNLVTKNADMSEVDSGCQLISHYDEFLSCSDPYAVDDDAYMSKLAAIFNIHYAVQ